MWMFARPPRQEGWVGEIRDSRSDIKRGVVIVQPNVIAPAECDGRCVNAGTQAVPSALSACRARNKRGEAAGVFAVATAWVFQRARRFSTDVNTTQKKRVPTRWTNVLNHCNITIISSVVCRLVFILFGKEHALGVTYLRAARGLLASTLLQLKPRRRLLPLRLLPT